MSLIDKTFFKQYYPRRAKDSYKNLNGKVFVIAGSKDMPGAAVLACRSAYKAGAGFVTIATVKELRPALINAVPEALIIDIESSGGYLNENSLKDIKEYIKANPQDVLLIGCGLSKGAEISIKVLQDLKIPSVIDADALNFIAGKGIESIKDIPSLLTPHIGEIKRLLGVKEFSEQSAALQISSQTGGVCLLKGPNTQVCFNGKKNINTSGNEGLAKAGSGDVLAGIISAIWAKLLKADIPLTPIEKGFLAASMGVYLHGAAADEAVKAIGVESLMASDVCEALPKTLKELLK